MSATDDFVVHRNLLFTVAYEILGSASDAEDVLQESWLRWAEVDHAEVRDPRAYLVRVVTRQALNRLRTQSRRRETYVGPWLPEPLLTAPDVADDVALAEHVSIAMLRVLDTLAPVERAVFCLHEVFGFGYDEIAAAVDKSEAACRQIASRARRHVAARRPRVADGVDRGAVMERFMAACAGGDLQAFLDVLAPDVVLISDGGGRAAAALRPITGRDKVVRFITGLASQANDYAAVRLEPVPVNAQPGFEIFLDEQRATTVVARVDGAVISEIYFMRNPDKLARMDGVVALAH
ncbi:RNA polymerase sigma-70 factor [Nocardioides coralli]|uniref:RNA polymerase sigma-70 factor n=1 Tax=Nocardioides coralli TaxID=2872154 RepID=UPI001CA3C42E|nr:RNA polymerase sigma-70 factor [Nocardioides coralli]QZY29396.1 RNA polymerase sigma-70 factor [Nocardioides coralli]